MKPLERQKIIVDMVHHHEVVQVSDISRVCQVSEMTIYRDVQKLEQEGRVQKTSRGITALVPEQTGSETCAYCQKPAGDRLSVQLVYNNRSQEKTCCGHCALLRFDEKSDEVVQMIGRDFLLDTTINVRQAVFVMNSSLPLFCCSPQTLVFQRHEEARKFAAGFGGSLMNFEEAVPFVRQDMGCACRSSHT